MNSNNKLSLEMIQDDLEGLSKKLYLESPDLWMDFLDKTGNNKFDEMVLYPWTLLKPADQIPRDNSGLLVDLFYTHTHTHMCLLVCIGFNHFLIYLSFTPFFSGNPGFLF